MDSLWRKVGLRDQHRTLVNTVPSLGGQIKSLWERWGLEISAVPSISPVNTVPSHGGQVNILWGKRRGLEINVLPSIPSTNTVPTHGGQTESLWRKAGLRDQHRTIYSTSQCSTTQWTGWKLMKKEPGIRAQLGTLYQTAEKLLSRNNNYECFEAMSGIVALLFEFTQLQVWWITSVTPHPHSRMRNAR